MITQEDKTEGGSEGAEPPRHMENNHQVEEKMTLYRQEICQECREPINDNSREHAADRPWMPNGSRKIWHFQCLPIERVASGEQTIVTDDLARYNTWRIQKLTEGMERENRSLRQRTSALRQELEKQMRANGATEDQIQDFRHDYRLQEDSRTAEETG